MRTRGGGERWGPVDTTARGCGDVGDGNSGMRMWGDASTGEWGCGDVGLRRGREAGDGRMWGRRARCCPPPPPAQPTAAQLRALRRPPGRSVSAQPGPHRSWNGSPPRPVPQRRPRGSKSAPGGVSFRGNRGTRRRPAGSSRGGGKAPGGGAGMGSNRCTEQQEAGGGMELTPRVPRRTPPRDPPAAPGFPPGGYGGVFRGGSAVRWDLVIPPGGTELPPGSDFPPP